MPYIYFKLDTIKLCMIGISENDAMNNSRYPSAKSGLKQEGTEIWMWKSDYFTQRRIFFAFLLVFEPLFLSFES